MSETFYVTLLKKYQVPDDTETTEWFRDEASNEDSVFDAEDLAAFVSSRKVLTRCARCKAAKIIGRTCIIIFNRKAMVYETVLCRRCFLQSSEWRATLAGRESWFYIEGERVEGAAFARAIGDDPSASCYAIDGGPL